MHRSFRSRVFLGPFAILALILALVAAAACADPPATEPARTPNPTCVAFAHRGSTHPLGVEPVFEDLRLTAPTGLAQAAGDLPHFFVSDLPVGLWRFDPSSPAASQHLVLDLARIGAHDMTRVYANELYSFALHPSFPSQPYVYAFYLGYLSDSYVFPFDRVVVVSRFTWDGAEFAPESEQNLMLLRGPSPDPEHDFEVSDHPGSIVGFGPDGYLYIAFGDLGVFPSSEDLQALVPSDKLDSLAGKIVRLDVDRDDSPYATPVDNPFGSSASCGAGVCPQIWASGFRHPWRGSIDPPTGRLWVGDVGWSHFEEINEVFPGRDYGWPTLEGDRCVLEGPTCEQRRSSLQPPVLAFGRDQAQAITGGYVYRGRQLDGFQGQYLFADWVMGTLHAFDPDAADPAATHRVVGDTGLSIASLARDAAGELYALHVPWAEAGSIHRIVAQRPSEGSQGHAPGRLSESGCFEPSDPRRPSRGLVPYRVNAQLWSDGAEKQRFFAIPDGTTIGVSSSGKLEFPPGSVLTKLFEVEDTLVEVRLLVRHDDGAWRGYSYEWREEEHDGFLLDSSLVRELDDHVWEYPSRTACTTCHTEAAGRSLGLEIGQLAHQVPSLVEQGYLTRSALEQVGSSDLPNPFAAHEPLERRARAYLHANCAGCHRPGGTTPVDIDFRFDTPLAQTNLCEVVAREPAGVAGGRRIAAGAPERSVIAKRMRIRGELQMPPLGTRVVDEAGAALIEQWISTLDCGSAR